MAHGITSTDNMAYVGDVPWHGLGVSMDANASLEDWQNSANFNWHIAQRASGFLKADGSFEKVAVENVRSDNEYSFGRVSEHYKPYQPQACLADVYNMAQEIGATMETAGTLFGGAHYWAMLKIGEGTYIKDKRDVLNNFILVSSSADGSRATDARRTSIRVVCNNTLTWALGGKRNKEGLRITHKSEVDFDKIKEFLGVNKNNIMEEFHREMETYRALANTSLILDDILTLTGKLLYDDKFDNANTAERNKMLEKQAARNIAALASSGVGAMGGDFAGVHRTGWGWLNAVTQYTDHASRAHNTENSTAQENRIDSAWFGKGADLKRKAVEIVTEYVGVNGETITKVETKDENSSALDMILNAA